VPAAYIPLLPPALLPLIVADGSDDPQDERPSGPQAVALALEDLQDALKLLLPDVGVQHVGQLLQGVQQQKLQPLGDTFLFH